MAGIGASMFSVFVFDLHSVADHAIDETNAKGDRGVVELLHDVGFVLKNPFLLKSCIAS